MVVPSRAVPRPLTPLLGRGAQVEELLERGQRHRLVTLTGMGGVGKTRLAMAVAQREAAAGADVVWLDLAGIPGPARPDAEDARFGGDLAAALAAAVCGPADPHATSNHRLVRCLAEAETLIVLDGCDRLVETCRDLVTALLQACAGLRFLTTTRELLGVPGELTWPVPGLPVEGGGEADGAVQLFVDRAAEAMPGFGVDPEGRAVIERICRRLDGLPLAIELAAARLRVLSVEQVAEGLDDCLRMLAAPRAALSGRHRTLETTLDFSHELLPPAEAALFRRLAVFPAGATLDAARAVTADDGRDGREDVLEPLTRLVERSLVQVDRRAATARYLLPDAVRQYAAARLAENGEDRLVEERQARWSVDVVEGLRAPLASVAWLEDVERELGNLRQAMVWSAVNAPELALRLAGRLWRFCWLRGRYGEGRTWTSRALRAVADRDGPGTAGGGSPELARVLHGAGVLAYLQCDYDEALERLDAALFAYPGSDPGTVEVLRSLAGIARERGDYERAVVLLRQVRELAESRGDRAGTARSDLALGVTAWLRGDHGRARNLAAAARTAYRRIGDAEGTTEAGLLLGLGALAEGRPDEATTLLAAARAEGEQQGTREIVAYALHGLGIAAGPATDPEAARALLSQALDVHHDLGDRWRSASVLDDLARCALALGESGEAARLVGEADAARDAIGAPVPAADAEARAVLAAVVEDSRRPTAGPARGTPAGPAPIASSEPVLGVRALGGSRISVAGRTIDASAWGYAKPRELLHFLLVHPPSGKGAIGTALWPDADQQALRGAFHTTLNRLRRVIGAERVVYAGGRYSIDPGRPLESDVAAFRQALRDAKADPEGRERHLRAAVQAYRGEYLAGEAPGEWVVPVREQLQRSAERALLELGHLLLERDDAPAAVPAFRRALELDPLLESAHRGLMQAQVRLGEPARALRQFEVLRRTLRAELRADPAPGTTALAHRIRVVASR